MDRMNTPSPAIPGLNVKGPAECKSLADVRADIDQIDARILDLLGLRFKYILPAAHFKLNDGKIVHDETRFRHQITRAGDLGEQRAMPRTYIERLWARMIELNVEIEEVAWAKAKAEREALKPT